MIAYEEVKAKSQFPIEKPQFYIPGLFLKHLIIFVARDLSPIVRKDTVELKIEQDKTLATMAPTLTDPTTAKTSPAYPLTQNNLEHLIAFKDNEGALSNSTVSKVNLPAGSLFSPITTHYLVPETTWSTVQINRTQHIELNSALLYINHSCQPSLEIDTARMEVRVARDRDLKVGDDLTYFYPSSEWKSPRPFKCLCGSPEDVCIDWQKGSHNLSKETLEKYFVNEHVQQLVTERDSNENGE